MASGMRGFLSPAPGAFALLALSAAETLATASTQVIKFDTFTQNTASFYLEWDTAQSAYSLVVPPDVRAIECSAQYKWATNTTGVRRALMTVNGAGNTIPGVGRSEITSGTNIDGYLGFSCGPFPVTPGDKLLFWGYQTSGGNLDVELVDETWVALKVVGTGGRPAG